MAMGLIAAALGGAGKALATVGEMEAKKQNEAKLRKELMNMESEERLRIDEITRRRDIEGIQPKAEATARAELAVAPIKGQAEVAGETAKLDAANTSGLSAKRAEFKAGEAIADIDARSKLKVAEKEANEAADKRVAELTAEKNKGVTKLEAEKTARVEKEKYDAMISAGVPKAKADALMAEYTAGDTLRKKQTDDAIAAEIAKVKGLSTSKDYISGKSKISVAESAGNIAEINAREAAYNRREKTKSDEEKNPGLRLERQIKETEKEIGRILRVGDPKKILDEISFLESQAKKGDKDAVEKLAKIKPLSDELNSLSRELRSYKRGDSDSSSDKSSGKNRPSIESFNR